MAQKRVPLRMCAICRRQMPKRELIRLVKDSAGQVSFDQTGKKAGRGLYVCPDDNCLNEALKGNRLEKVIGAKVEAEVLAQLKEKVGNESKS